MALYENIFIVRQDISSAQVDAITDSFEEIVNGLGGSVAKREYWGLRTLAYRIKKNKKGHYVLFNIDAPYAAINELGRQMRLHEDVLRELTIRLDSFPETPSPIMLTKGDRDRDRASRETRTAETAGDGAAINIDKPKQEPEAASELATADKELDAVAPAEEKKIAVDSVIAKPKRTAAKKLSKATETEETAEEENS
mgnify:CR=1 FL=1